MSGLVSRQASELAEALGEEGLEKLIERCRGQRFRVHARPRLNSELARRLGPVLYRSLQSVYRGEIIEVPSPRRRHRDTRGRFASDRTEREKRVHALREQGLTISTIAACEGISDRWVRALLAANG